ncbi:MAG: hypothetical protein VCB25_03370 [Myxococcota bacterium]
MSNLSNLDLLESIITAKGRILRAEADRTGPACEALALTFDVGRVLIQSGGDGLIVSQAEDREALPEDMVPLDEEEPWWRLLGEPISAAWPGGVEAGVGAKGLSSLLVLKLQFRAPSDNSRVICIESTGRLLRVSLAES